MRRVVKPGGKVAVMVYAALEVSLSGICSGDRSPLGNIPPPAPGDPGCIALGEPGALEGVYRRGDFLMCRFALFRYSDGLPSAAAAVENMRKGARRYPGSS